MCSVQGVGLCCPRPGTVCGPHEWSRRGEVGRDCLVEATSTRPLPVAWRNAPVPPEREYCMCTGWAKGLRPMVPGVTWTLIWPFGWR